MSRLEFLSKLLSAYTLYLIICDFLIKLIGLMAVPVLILALVLGTALGVFLTVWFPRRPIKIHDAPTGHVYLLKDVATPGCYKIGHTRNLGKRMETFEAFLPPNVMLVHKILCDDPEEAHHYLIRRYGGKRVGQNWYKLSERQVAAIRKIDLL